MYTKCTLCKEEGHNAAKCPDLTDPLQPGFSGAGGGGGNSHDHDDDESLSSIPSYQISSLFEYRKSLRIISIFHKISHSKLVLN